jgi:hypothetical protein
MAGGFTQNSGEDRSECPIAGFRPNGTLACRSARPSPLGPDHERAEDRRRQVSQRKYAAGIRQIELARPATRNQSLSAVPDAEDLATA